MAIGEFELGVLTQGNAAAHSLAAPLREPAPDSGSVEVIESIEEMRSAINRVASSAQRLMSIYTPDLEPDIYDQSSFLEIVKRFVLARRFAKVRVLLDHTAKVSRDHHRFVAMSRRLTSYIDLRVAPQPVEQRAAAYIIADDRAIAYRVQANSWDGVADYNNPPVARMHLAEFDAAWMACESERAAMQRAIR
jgi:hypothetical protein